MSYNKYCDVCGEYNPNGNHVMRISDDKGYKDIIGHAGCVNKVHSRYEKLNAEKWNVAKTIAALGIEKEG